MFLDAAYDGGFDVEGVEFNRYAYEFVRGKYTFPLSFGGIEEIVPGRERYDVICMLDVIEHLLKPRAAMDRVAALLGKGGLCVLQTMDSTSTVSKILGKRLEDFRRIREHLYFFDRSTIRRFLAGVGLEVVSISSIGHTFELGFAMDRMAMIWPGMFRTMKKLIRPRWLLEASLYINPGTKMLVIAKKV